MIALSATLFFGILTAMLFRNRSIRLLDTLIVGTFGFLLASSMWGASIRLALAAVLGIGHGADSVPLAPAAPAPTSVYQPYVHTDFGGGAGIIRRAV